jgi:hypothetical protein
MATENDITGFCVVLRELGLSAAKEDGAPKEQRLAFKAAMNLLEILLCDIHRIADAAERSKR